MRSFLFVLALIMAGIALANANTADNIVNGQTDLTATATYSGGIPGSASDVIFPSGITYSPTDFTLNTNAFNLNIGTLNDLDISQELTIDNTSNDSASTITFNGGPNSVSGNATDLLYVAAGGTLLIGTSSTGTLNLVLAATGSFDIAGTANIGANISSTVSGFSKTGGGTLTLSGTSSFSGSLSPNEGTLIITGQVTTNATSGIATTGTVATIIVSGPGASWTSNADTLIGLNNGTGNLIISDGAVVSDTFSLVGRHSTGDTGNVTVTGEGSLWTHTAGIVIGTGGVGTLLVADGGHVFNADGTIGGDDGSTGTVRVTGADSLWTSTSYLLIGSAGTGVLTVDCGGTVEVGSTGTGVITLGSTGAGAGTLNIGAAVGRTALDPGTILATTVTGGTGTGAKLVNFNHTSADYTFAPNLTGSLSVEQNAGVTILTGTNTYTGTTTINGGVLQFAQTTAMSATSAISVESGATLAVNAGGSGEFTADASGTGSIGNILSTASFASGANLGIDTTNAAGGDFVYSNVLTDTNSGANVLGLTKLGGNTLSLTAANTFSGVTTVYGGTLELDNNLALQNSTLNTDGGGRVSLTVSNPVFGGLSGGTDLASVITSGYGGVSNLTLNTPDGVTDTYSGNISNGAPNMTLTKIGNGTQVLTGGNHYGGNTIIDFGTLMVDGGSININYSNYYQSMYVGDYSGDKGALVVTDSGLVEQDSGLYVGENSGSSGSVTVENGSYMYLPIGITVGDSGSGALTISDGGQMLSGNTVYVGHNANSFGSVTVTGAGAMWTTTYVLNLGYSGSGTLTISNGGQVYDYGSAIMAFDTPSIATATVTGTNSIWINNNGLTVGYFGSATLTISDSGVVTATNGVRVAVASGNSTVNLDSGGALKTSSISLGGGTGAINFDGGILQATANSSTFVSGFGAGAITLASGGGTIDTQGYTDTITSPLGGSGALTKIGPGILILSGANTYSGGTTVSGGILQFAQTAAMPVAGTISVESGATLAVNVGGSGEFTADTSGAGSIGNILSTVTFASGSSLGIDTTDAGGSFTYAGDITNAGMGLVKLGQGALYLSGANTYTGGTIVDGGSIVLTGSINGPLTVNSGAFIAQSGGTLNGDATVGAGGTLGGGGTVNGKITVTSGGSTYPGDPQILTATSVEYQDGSTAQFAIDTNKNAPPVAGADYDQIKLTGTGTALVVDSGTTSITLDLGDMTLQTLQANVGTANDTYVLFVLENGTTAAQFTNLTLVDGANTYTASIVDGNADFASLDLEFAFSDSVTDPTSGETGFGFNVLSASVPEPSDYAPLFAFLLVVALWLRQRATP